MKQLICILSLMVVSAHAAPPPDPDPKLHAWFERQHSMRGGLCCSIADGHILNENEWRAISGSYEVLIKDVWYKVPENALRDPSGGPNPTGQAIVWYSDKFSSMTIYCFAPGFEY